MTDPIRDYWRRKEKLEQFEPFEHMHRVQGLTDEQIEQKRQEFLAIPPPPGLEPKP